MKTKPETYTIYHPAPKRFIAHLMKIIVEKNISKRVIIQSFDIITFKIPASAFSFCANIAADRWSDQ
ncbi:MAG TPA: hypothetical protein VM101_11790 [Flavitalea sp.]|nr:hypothetical protein [Flavitalea sp.]